MRVFEPSPQLPPSSADQRRPGQVASDRQWRSPHMDINVRCSIGMPFVLRAGLHSMRPRRHGFLGEIENVTAIFLQPATTPAKARSQTHPKCVIGLVDPIKYFQNSLAIDGLKFLTLCAPHSPPLNRKENAELTTLLIARFNFITFLF